MSKWKCSNCQETWNGDNYAIAHAPFAPVPGVWVAKHANVATCPSCEPHIPDQEGGDWHWVKD
jgi:hypothetical protein